MASAVADCTRESPNTSAAADSRTSCKRITDRFPYHAIKRVLIPV